MVTVTVNLVSAEDAVRLVQKLADLGYRHARIRKTIDVTKPMEIEDGLVWRDLQLQPKLGSGGVFCGLWEDAMGEPHLKWFTIYEITIRNKKEETSDTVRTNP